MKKIFTFLLALAASVGMMNAKVTWNSSNISDLKVRSYQSYSKEGVTLSANSDMVEARWQDFGDESMDGISFNANETGGYTFSNTLGKNFTKIEMFSNRGGGWDYANLGSGWSFYWDYSDNPATVTWTGNAATVDLLKETSSFNAESVKSIVFYFEGDSEAPDPTYTVALEDGTVNADKVKLSATSAVEGATITVTPNEEYEITAFKAYYVVVEDQLGSIYDIDATLNTETGAYSFTMPAYDVTIEATIALKPVYTVALEEGTVNADKVTLSATSVIAGKTVTVTPNEDYEITAFSAYYVVVNGQVGSINEIDATLDPETGAYSFTMPAYDVTIEATIVLKPVPEGDIFAGFTATAGSGGFDNEVHANLVDNKFTSTDWTKWCTNDGHKSVPTGESESCWWIDFEASAALNPTGYILTTGNDTGSEHGRNPKNWVLKAKLNAGDAWTTIATVTDDVTMKNKSFKDYKFFVDKSGSYKYFRFEVFANQGANVMQLCELRLIGTEASEPVLVTAHTLQLHVNNAAMGSVAVTNLLGSDIVDNGDGTFTVPEGAEVTLLATPNEGYEFSGWKASQTICDFAECEFVALPTVDNPLTFDMYAEAAFMAEFKAVTPTPEPEGTDTITWDNAFCMKVDAYYDGDKKSIVEENNEKDGIKVTCVGEEWDEGFTGGDIELYELSSILTFTSTVGNFQKIEIYYINSYHAIPDGWTEDATNKKFVWEGTPAAAVNMQKGTGNVDFEVDHIVFIVESQGTPTGVENVQTNQVQAIKFFRDGQLLIEKNGKIYNVMGTVVR